MEYNMDELLMAKKQIESTLHKIREVIKTLSAKDNPDRYKSQLTLAKRRIFSFEIALDLIDREISKLK